MSKSHSLFLNTKRNTHCLELKTMKKNQNRMQQSQNQKIMEEEQQQIQQESADDDAPEEVSFNFGKEVVTNQIKDEKQTKKM